MPWALILRFGPWIVAAVLTVAVAFYRQEAIHAKNALRSFQASVQQVGEMAISRNKGISDGWKRQVKEAEERGNGNRPSPCQA